MNDHRYREAKQRVKAKKEFYRHLGTYFVMSTFFFLLNAVTTFGNWWFVWPMLGWGLAVLFHYVDVFGIPYMEPMNQEWEEREIRRELRRLEGRERYMNREYHRRQRPVRSNHRPSGSDERLELKPLPKPQKNQKWDDSELV